MSIRTSWAGIAMLCVAVLALPLQVASAAAPELESGSDTAAYASLFDVTQAEAGREVKLQYLAGELELVLSDALPDTFGGLWITHEPAFSVVIALTSGAQSDVEPYIPRDLETSIRLQTVSRTQENLQHDAETLAAALPDGYAVTVAISDNEVVVWGPDATLLADVAAKGIAPISSVRFANEGLTGGPSAELYGGLSISGCTSGFGVKQNGVNSTGILTAGHCADAQSYQGVSLTFKQGIVSGNHDEQWHTSTFTETNRIRVTPNGGNRFITSRTTRAATPIGGLVCKYGMITNYGCGSLVSKSFAPSWVPNAQPTFMQVHQASTDLSTPGDSGGPVFLNNTAYGIVEGWWGAQDGTNSDLIYTAVDYPESWLGVTVLTQ